MKIGCNFLTVCLSSYETPYLIVYLNPNQATTGKLATGWQWTWPCPVRFMISPKWSIRSLSQWAILSVRGILAKSTRAYWTVDLWHSKKWEISQTLMRATRNSSLMMRYRETYLKSLFQVYLMTRHSYGTDCIMIRSYGLLEWGKKTATSGNRTRASRVAGENSTTEPTLLEIPARKWLYKKLPANFTKRVAFNW